MTLGSAFMGWGVHLHTGTMSSEINPMPSVKNIGLDHAKNLLNKDTVAMAIAVTFHTNLLSILFIIEDQLQ